MQVRALSDVRAIAATAVGLLLVALVALASGGSPWHAGGRQDVPVSAVNAVAAAVQARWSLDLVAEGRWLTLLADIERLERVCDQTEP